MPKKLTAFDRARRNREQRALQFNPYPVPHVGNAGAGGNGGMNDNQNGNNNNNNNNTSGDTDMADNNSAGSGFNSFGNPFGSSVNSFNIPNDIYSFNNDSNASNNSIHDDTKHDKDDVDMDSSSNIPHPNANLGISNVGHGINTTFNNNTNSSIHSYKNEDEGEGDDTLNGWGLHNNQSSSSYDPGDPNDTDNKDNININSNSNSNNSLPPPPQSIPTRRIQPGRPNKITRLTASPVVTCAAEAALIAGRIDEAKLTEHLAALTAYQAKYEKRLQEQGTNQAQITEAKGERAATFYMVQNYIAAKVGTDYQILWTFAPGGGIDQLWYSPAADTYCIVEAKGLNAELSTNAQKGAQMSTIWVLNSLNEVLNSDSSDAAAISHARRMTKAILLRPPPFVHGLVLNQQRDGTSWAGPCPDNGVYHKT